MRSELVKKMFEAYAENNNKKFIEAANEIIYEEEKKNHVLFAKDLKKTISSLQKTNNELSSYSKIFKSNIPIPRDTEKGFPLLEVREYYNNFDDLILNSEIKQRLEYIIDEFKYREILRTYGLNPKQKILLCGPPGTGKTLSAKVLSSVLHYPLVYVRFDSIISSFLGETATNLRKIFDFIEDGQWVVLFDEFDIIGKRRDDPYEHGEIKRVVNNFMQMLDSYEGNSLLIASTNHQHLLDTAIWRRFDEILLYDLPDQAHRIELFNKYLRVMERSQDIDLKELSKLTNEFSPADIAQVCEEALRQVIITNKNEIGLKEIKWAINQQIRKKKIIKEI